MRPTLHVAYTKHGKVTGREIAKLLGATTFGTRRPEYTPEILVRWGSRRTPMPYSGWELNPPSAIYKASDKITCLKALAAAGVRTIPWDTDPIDLINQGHQVILGRSRFGSRGRGIVPYLYNTGDFGRHEWYSAYVRSNREYRLHVVDNRVVRVQGKYQDKPEEETSKYIRNYANGWRFRAPKKDLHSTRKHEAIEAVKALGLVFGAVDMLVSDGEPSYILEVNTAPACSPRTANCYAGAIGQYLAQMSQGRWEVAADLLQNEVPDMPEEGDWEEGF